MNYNFPNGTTLPMGDFLRAWLGGEPSFEGMMESIKTMLNDEQSPTYIGDRVVVTSGGEERFLRDELSLMAERIDYAGAILARYRIFELGWEPVTVRDFGQKLVIGVESVAAMVLKLRDMLENQDNPEWVEPGIPVRCSCLRDLRSHLQDLLDDPEMAEGFYLYHSQPEEEDDIARLLAELSDQFGVGGSGGEGPRIRIVMLGPGSDLTQ